MKTRIFTQTALLVSLAGSTQALAQSFPAVIELSSLDGSNGFVLNGIEARDNSGISVASAGDINGDGVDDIIIGALRADPNGLSSGESYVVFGGGGVGSTGTIELSELDGSNGFLLRGIDAYDNSGRSVSSAGDFNGDGVDDLIIGGTSTSCVVLGGADVGSSGVIELSSLDGTNGFILNDIAVGDRSGGSVSSAGDVNGDGLADLIVGAYNADPNGLDEAGETYVVFGSVEEVGSAGTLDLSSLNGANGFVLNGVSAYDYSGDAVSSAGDINGDGFDDLIVGAYFADPNGVSSAGASYVVFGGAGVGGSGTIELSSLDGTNGFVLNGIDAGDFSGVSVSSAGDVNGDGVDDLIIGASSADPNGNNFAGESYVVFGGAGVGSAGTIELSSLDGTNGFVLNGIDFGDFSGYSVSSAGDVNGDGVDDLIIGASSANPNGNHYAGESYVVFGGAGVGSSGTIELSSLNGTNGFVLNGINSYDGGGRSVSSAGDVNDDGVDDFIIGANGAAPNGINRAGASYVVFGRQDPATRSLASLNGATGFAIHGVAGGDESGGAVSSAGDINADGIDDLIIGASGAEDAGASYVVFGGTSVGTGGDLELSSLDGANGFAIEGAATGDQSGVSVSGAGDVNGDGVDDLIIGATGADPNGNSRAGETYVVFGGMGVGASGVFDLSTLNGSNGFVLTGVDASDFSGFSVSGVGDVNGDGEDDLVIGAFRGDPNGTESGESYVVFGGMGVGAGGVIDLSSLDGSNGFVINGVSGGDVSGFSAAGAGDVNADGVSDLIIGAIGADAGGNSDAGASYLVFGGKGLGSSGTLELASLSGGNGLALGGVVAGDRSGGSVSSAGDVNADGIDDLIIGASSASPDGAADAGATYVLFGSTFLGSSRGVGGTFELAFLDGSNGFVLNGVAAGDGSGVSVSGVGDVNADGVDDLIVGASGADTPGDADAGVSYVVLGGVDLGAGGGLDLASLNGVNGYALRGVAAGDGSGVSVSGAGDFNGDGGADLIIGASGADPDGNAEAGTSYIVFGAPNPDALNPADLTGDGCVDTFDLAALLAAWGGAGADLNSDGVTDAFDLAIVLAAWGNGC